MTTIILIRLWLWIRCDVMRMNQDHASQCPIVDEESNPYMAKFFDLLKDSDEPL